MKKNKLLLVMDEKEILETEVVDEEDNKYQQQQQHYHQYTINTPYAAMPPQDTSVLSAMTDPASSDARMAAFDAMSTKNDIIDAVSPIAEVISTQYSQSRQQDVSKGGNGALLHSRNDAPSIMNREITIRDSQSVAMEASSEQPLGASPPLVVMSDLPIPLGPDQMLRRISDITAMSNPVATFSKFAQENSSLDFQLNTPASSTPNMSILQQSTENHTQASVPFMSDPVLSTTRLEQTTTNLSQNYSTTRLDALDQASNTSQTPHLTIENVSQTSTIQNNSNTFNDLHLQISEKPSHTHSMSVTATTNSQNSPNNLALMSFVPKSPVTKSASVGDLPSTSQYQVELKQQHQRQPTANLLPKLDGPELPLANDTKQLEPNKVEQTVEPLVIATAHLPPLDSQSTMSMSALPDKPPLLQAELNNRSNSVDVDAVTSNIDLRGGSTMEGSNRAFLNKHVSLPDALGMDGKDIGSPEVQNAIVERSPGGRYVRFLEKLGSGASKDVFRAYDTQEGIEVAWNVVSLSGVPKNERNRIVNEVRLLERLHHHNIISFHGSWVNRERQEVNFVTEILSSGTLKSFIHKVQVIRWKIAKRWARQILSGLHYLHSQDPPVIHRDLKCDNIFINGTSGDLRIGDLGLSTVHRNGRVLSVLGTPEFMAPDMYEEKPYDERVDIYAFGMCMLEIFTKEIPYSECKNPAQIYMKVSSGEHPEVLKRIQSRNARDFVLLCLGYKNEEGNYVRPSAAELLNHPFLETRQQSDDDEVLVDPPLRALTIHESRESSPMSKTPQTARKAYQVTDFQSSVSHIRTSATTQVVSNVKNGVPAEARSLDDADDGFEEMPESETNFRKVKVLMGRGRELKEDDDDASMTQDEKKLSPRNNISANSAMTNTMSMDRTPPQSMHGPTPIQNEVVFSAAPQLPLLAQPPPPPPPAAAAAKLIPQLHYLVAAAVIENEELSLRPYADDVLKLVVTLPVEGQTQNVQFDFHLVEDDPIQVAKEMVQELGIPPGAVLEISETISGLARAARMKQDKYNSLLLNGQKTHVPQVVGQVQNSGTVVQNDTYKPPTPAPAGLPDYSSSNGMSSNHHTPQLLHHHNYAAQQMHDNQQQNAPQQQPNVAVHASQQLQQPHSRQSSNVSQSFYDASSETQVSQQPFNNALQIQGAGNIPSVSTMNVAPRQTPNLSNHQNIDPVTHLQSSNANHMFTHDYSSSQGKNGNESQGMALQNVSSGTPVPANQQAYIPNDTSMQRPFTIDYIGIQTRENLVYDSTPSNISSNVAESHSIHVRRPVQQTEEVVQVEHQSNMLSNQSLQMQYNTLQGPLVQPPPTLQQQQLSTSSQPVLTHSSDGFMKQMNTPQSGFNQNQQQGLPTQNQAKYLVNGPDQNVRQLSSTNLNAAFATQKVGQADVRQQVKDVINIQEGVIDQNMSRAPVVNANQPNGKVVAQGHTVPMETHQTNQVISQSQNSDYTSLQNHASNHLHQSTQGSIAPPPAPRPQAKVVPNSASEVLQPLTGGTTMTHETPKTPLMNPRGQLSAQSSPVSDITGLLDLTAKTNSPSLGKTDLLHRQHEHSKSEIVFPMPVPVTQRASTTGTSVTTSPARSRSTSEDNYISEDDEDEDDDDEEFREEMRKLEEDYMKNLQRAKKVFDSRMDNLQRSQIEREAQHLKTLEKHEKERAEFEKRLALEAEQQNKRMEQLQRDWEKRRQSLAKHKKRPNSTSTELITNESVEKQGAVPSLPTQPTAAVDYKRSPSGTLHGQSKTPPPPPPPLPPHFHDGEHHEN